MKMEQDPRFKHLETVVGAFVLAALATLVAAVVYLGTASDIFGDKYHLRFRSDSGAGLQKGMPVKLSGFRIGRIQKLALDDQAKVVVWIRIDRKYSRWIRKDSTATLYKEGLVGDSVIDISVGSPDKPELEEDDFLPFEAAGELSDIAIRLSDSVQEVLGEVRHTVDYINDPDGDVKKTLANVRLLTANLEETRRNADALLRNVADNVGKVGPMFESMTALVDDVGRTVTPMLDNVSLRIPVLLERVEKTAAETEKIAQEFRKTAEKSAPGIPRLVAGAEELVEDTDDVVKGMKKMWPFRKHIPRETRPGIVPGDSHE
ncbi:MAG: MlaD family protein [Thermodesulfobacteriota bacterium]